MTLSLLCRHISKCAEGMSVDILASKFIVVIGTYSSKLGSFLCPDFLAKRLVLVTYLY